MSTLVARIGASIVSVLLIAGCVAAEGSPGPSSSPPFSPYLDPDPSPAFSPYLDPDPSPAFSPYLDPNPSPPPSPYLDPNPSPPFSPASPAPSPQPSTTTAASLAIPVHESAYLGAPGLRAASDGSLLVLVPAGAGTLVVLYGPGGEVRPGWPVALAGSGCQAANPASDGTIRIVCSVASGTRAFAFDDSGRALKGWPVDVAGSLVPMPPVDPVVVGTRLVTLVVDDLGDIPAGASIASIDATGRLTSGARVPFADWTGWWALGPDGVAYNAHFDDTEGGLPSKTTVLAFDSSGVRAGWPIEIAGMVSSPVFGPAGHIRVLRGRIDASPTEVLELTPPRASVVASLATPLGGAWEGAGAPLSPAPAIRASDGGLFVVSGGIGAGSGVVAGSIAVDGSPRPGWPYRDDGALAPSSYCGPLPGDVDVLGCGTFRAPPLAGPDRSLYLLEVTGGPASRGRIVAVGGDGRTRAGWPVVLSQAGAVFWDAVVADTGTVYALAVEPGGDRIASATILAIAPDGSVGWRHTVKEP